MLKRIITAILIAAFTLQGAQLHSLPSISAYQDNLKTREARTTDIPKRLAGEMRNTTLLSARIAASQTLQLVLDSLGKLKEADNTIELPSLSDEPADRGNAWRAIPFELNSDGQRFFKELLSIPAVDENAHLIVSQSNGSIVPYGILFFSRNGRNSIFFNTSRLLMPAGTPTRQIPKVQKILPLFSASNDEYTQIGFEVENSSLGFNVLNIIQEQRDGSSVGRSYSSLGLFSIQGPDSKDWQECLARVSGFMKGKRVEIHGPGLGIDILYAVRAGAQSVIAKDILRVYVLLSQWNLQYAKDSGDISRDIPVSIEEGGALGPADIYLFNAPAIRSLRAFQDETKNAESELSARAVFISAPDFLKLFKELKEKLLLPNTVAIWRVCPRLRIDRSEPDEMDLIKASPLAVAKNFLREQGFDSVQVPGPNSDFFLITKSQSSLQAAEALGFYISPPVPPAPGGAPASTLGFAERRAPGGAVTIGGEGLTPVQKVGIDEAIRRKITELAEEDERSEIAVRSVLGHALVDNIKTSVDVAAGHLNLALLLPAEDTEMTREYTEMTQGLKLRLQSLKESFVNLERIQSQRHYERKEVTRCFEKLRIDANALQTYVRSVRKELERVSDISVRYAVVALEDVSAISQSQIEFLEGRLDTTSVEIGGLVLGTEQWIAQTYHWPGGFIKIANVDLRIKSIPIQHRLMRRLIGELAKNTCQAHDELKAQNPNQEFPAPCLKISVFLDDKKENVILTFEDNAGGITDESLLRAGKFPGRQKLFDLGETTKEAGTGIGLAEAWSIAKAHSGSISARSSPGIGTTFEMRLPLNRQLIAPALPAPPVDSVIGDSGKGQCPIEGCL